MSTPGIVSDQDRKNLSLYTTCGPIDTEIWIVHDGSGESKRVSMELTTDDGSVRATIVRFLYSSVVPCFEEYGKITTIIIWICNSTTLLPLKETAMRVQLST